MAWIPFDGTVTGTLVPGDRDVPATRWYNHLWLLLFGWKTVAVFEAKMPNTVDPFYVGYRAFDGTAKLCDEPMRGRMFRMLVGHEDCTFFAVDRDRQEVPLTLIRRCPRKDPAYAAAPLL